MKTCQTTPLDNFKLSPQVTWGDKIANCKGILGTAGCLAYLRKSGEPVILSAWHVMFGKGAVINDKVWLARQFRECHSVTEVGKVVAGKIGNIWYHNWEVYVDCAISTFTLNNYQVLTTVVEGYGEAFIGDSVYKIGAATGMTKGIVIKHPHFDKACIEGNTVLAKSQLLIRSKNGIPFSSNGDSGSVILNMENKVVGLLWGTNCWGEGLACPIAPVMSMLNIEFNASPELNAGSSQLTAQKFK